MTAGRRLGAGRSADVIIVAGSIEVAPEHRDAFIEERTGAMRRSRAEAGCLEYVFAADPLDPGRVVLLERWASEEALSAHVAAMRSDPPDAGGVAPVVSQVAVFDVAGERRLGG